MSAKTSRTSAAQTRARLKAAREQVGTDDIDDGFSNESGPGRPAAVSPPGPSALEAEPVRLPESYQSSPTPATPTVLPQSLPAPTHSSNDGRHQKGTGIDVAADLVERVQREARTRSRGGQVITQTEVVLQAFEQIYPRLPTLIARHQQQQQVNSPLFGTRSVHGSSKVGAIKRLQIRPTYDEKNQLHALADHFKLPLSELTRIVLRAYFHPEE
ncbi:hypothetical protein AB0C84_44770 [Actinomadura sp. NPDC048955]|uniref:hypothetical protein n=1 Tax=Actinomadura sp. NPDC048955 TaxID=3158228 RepID=UPI0033C71957